MVNEATTTGIRRHRVTDSEATVHEARPNVQEHTHHSFVVVGL